jgi:hypothetical protein
MAYICRILIIYIMEITTIRTTKEVRDKLEELKVKYQYTTLGDCIKGICLFIDRNSLNPTAVYAEEYTAIFRSDLRMYFEELRKLIDGRDQSMRKFLGAIEKSYLKPLISNTAVKNTIEAHDLTPPPPQSVLKVEPKIEDKKATNKTDSQELERLSNKVELLKKAYEEISSLYEIYKDKLSYLISNVKLSKSMVGEEYISINMTHEEWKKFKESIPNF